MDDTVPQTNNFGPFDLGVLGLEILRQPVGGLSDDLQVSHDRINGLLIFYKSIVIHTRHIAFDLFNRFPNVLDQEGKGPT